MDDETACPIDAERARHLVRLARLQARPRRAAGVEVVPAPGAAGAYVLRDAAHRRYARLGEDGLFLWNELDGERSAADLSVAYFRRYGRLGVDAVLETIGRLRAAGFVEAPDAEPELLRLAEGAGRLRRAAARLASWTRGTLSLPDPDRALGLLHRLARPLFLPPVQLALPPVALAGAALYAHELVRGGHVAAPHGHLAVAALAGFEAQVVLHELAHALTTKHFGREVHRAGVGWYLFWPVAFVDTSDMWLEGKLRRMAVAGAGPYANLVLSGIAGCLLPLAGATARPTLLLFATAGYVLALGNLNPLYELDGYYLLSDWLDVPNLRAKALAHVGARLRRAPAPDARHARVLAVYGVAAALYACAAAGLVFLGYRRLVRHAVAHVLPAPAAGGLAAGLAAALALLLLLGLRQSLRRAA